MFHPKAVSDWLDKKPIYPIYMEISPSGSCNHRCTYCALDFMEYEPNFLYTPLLKIRLVELGKLGVKSIMYAGEGEPLLHEDISEIIRTTRNSGIDVALTTNGVFLDKIFKDLPYLSWIKVSINASSPETYAKIHRTRSEDFNRVIYNLTLAAKGKKSCILGAQIVLLPDNYKEVFALAQIVKDIGLDYLVVKPYSQHLLSKTKLFKDIKYSQYLDLYTKLRDLNSKDFNVVFRLNAMKKWDKVERNYKHCLALPFWSYIDAKGNVWACSMYLTKNKFNLGNIYKTSFKEIWESKKHTDLIDWASKRLDTNKCRVNCRMDEVNRYLWDLTNAKHLNFI
jgi:GTP 3',8-cyclase